MNLDKKDKMLLLELDMDARASLGELSKKLGLSKKGVDYKIKKLEDEGIILGYRTLVDATRLGYYFFRLFFTFKASNDREREEFENFIKQDERFNYVFHAKGKYNYAAAFWGRNFEEYEEFLTGLLTKWKGKFTVLDEWLPVNLIYLQNRFFQESTSSKILRTTADVDSFTLDETEKAILKEISVDARQPIYKIAYRLGLESRQVSYRLKKLEREGIILSYRTSIDYRKLGYSYFKCLLELEGVDKVEFNQIVREISVDPRSIVIGHTVNIMKLDLSLILFSIDEFYQFIENLEKKFPSRIKSYETFLIGENIKFNYVPFL